MDPTAAELATLTSMVEVFKWVELSGDPDDDKTIAGSLAALIGATAGTKPRSLCMVSTDDFKALLATWRVPSASTDRAPTLVEIGKAQLVIRACHLVGGQGQSLEDLKKAAAATATTPASPAPASSSASPRKIKLSSVASQVDDTEIKLVTGPDIIGYSWNMRRSLERVRDLPKIVNPPVNRFQLSYIS